MESNAMQSLQLYLLYCYFIMHSLFNVYKKWTLTFNIHLPNYPSGQGVGFPVQESWTQKHWMAPRSPQPFILPGLIQ